MNQISDKSLKQTIVLGTGAGQCGLDLLKDVLDCQESSGITQDQSPLLPWRHLPESSAIKERFNRWKSAAHALLIGDVATFYLPYVKQAIACEPDVRIVCLQRSQDEVVSAFIQFLDEKYQLPINHWTDTPGPCGHHDPLWTRTFPQYEQQDRAEGIARYWSEYYELAEKLSEQYPENVRVFDMSALMTEQGIGNILDFVGIQGNRQVIAVDQQADQPVLAARVMQASTPRSDNPLDPQKCVILVPYLGSIHQQCEAALKELERRGYRVRRVGGYAAIDQGRNQMATDALNDGFEETLWIDSDIGFHADAVEKLRRHELPVVCGIYPQKARRAFACQIAPETQQITFGADGGLLEIQYAGTGFLLVRREVYSTIQQKLDLPVCNERFGRPTIPFFLPMVREDGDGHWYLPEDFSFGERVKQSGFNVYADTSIRLWHIGTYRYGWEDVGLERPRHDSFTLNVMPKRPD